VQSDTIKLLFTYFIALIVIVGGGVFLYLIRAEPEASDLQLAIVGFIGGALAFVFNRESATQATRAAASATAAALTPPGNGNQPRG